MSNIGAPVTRADGPIKVTGKARYAGDQKVDGQLHAIIVPATIASGRIISVNKKAAMAMPGVVRVLASSDMPDLSETLSKISVPPLATRVIPLQSDAVSYEGQAVALVLAETLEAAEAGAQVVRVEYEESSFINAETAESVHPGKDNEDNSSRGNYPLFNKLDYKKGEGQAAIASAPVKVSGLYTQPSRHANPMEPSAILSVWQGDNLTVYDATQHLEGVQSTLAEVFGISAEQVRVISPHTGGGFGIKGFLWPHEVLGPMAARAVRRPVKLVLQRRDMYAMVGPQPQLEQQVELGAGRDNKIQGIAQHITNVTCNEDDYVEFGTVVSRHCYASDNIESSQKVRRGNMIVPSYMRSPWDGPGSWGLGSAMDELARELNVDPLDLRLVNYAEVDPDTGNPWSSKKLREAYAKAAKRFGWRERPKGGTRDGNWRIGCGMADCTKSQARYRSSARIRLKANGTARIESSLSDIGCGTATVFPQIVGGLLGLSPDQVVAYTGDSNLAPAGPAFGSAATLSTGNALSVAATDIRRKLAKLAGWSADQIEMREGRIWNGDESRTIADVMNDAGVEEIASDGSFELPGGGRVDFGVPERATLVFGAIFVEVGVDPELGLLRLRRATGAYSVGRIINPLTSRSQAIGGIIWGWGMAALEASHFDGNLGRWMAKDLSGVSLPVNADIPPDIDIVFTDEFDEFAGPLGAKGIGEVPATGVAAAVANAVYDAIGLRVRDLPITAEKILQA